MLLLGCDFTSAPSRRKPIVVAVGAASEGGLRLQQLHAFDSLAAWGDWLARTPRWVGGFDFLFGLPRELVEHLGWPLQWEALVQHYSSLSRAEIRSTFAAFCAARPVGAKFAHRATDGPAGSSPSMKWVQPPVAYMMHAGLPPLLAAGASLPGLRDLGPQASRVALEAYPGMLARALIGRRSYKADDRARQNTERLAARGALLDALQAGAGRWELRLRLTQEQQALLLADAQGDRIDAVLCLLLAAWAARRPGWGLPGQIDAIEGWIVSA